MKRRLDLGCGLNKAPGSIGVDSNRDATAADVLADLNGPLPFSDGSFDEVRAVHVIEHVHDIMQTMAEIHRVARPGGRVYLVTPHHTDSSSWRDPTHRWHLNSYSFRFWTARGLHQERHWYTRLELREVYLHVELARLWRCAGLQWLVNRFECFRRFWEQYLCFVVRAKQMEFTFEVVKNREGPEAHAFRARGFYLPKAAAESLDRETQLRCVAPPSWEATEAIPAWAFPQEQFHRKR